MIGPSVTSVYRSVNRSLDRSVNPSVSLLAFASRTYVRTDGTNEETNYLRRLGCVESRTREQSTELSTIGDKARRYAHWQAMSTATNGRAREYRVRDHMIGKGWACIMRAAASKGAADLLMAHPEYGAALVQVGTKSKTLGPADRARFLVAAELCSALPLLAVPQPGKGITFWQVSDATASKWERWTL